MEEFNIIDSYTANEAIADGILFPVNEQITKEAGYKIPVRITSGVRQLLVPSEASVKSGQSYDGRLWDVLSVAMYKMRANKDGNLVQFTVKISNRNHKMYAALDGTSGMAVHIMLPDEY